MKAVVVYESMFGNTRSVADAIAEGLGTNISVVLTEVGDAPPPAHVDADLLVVGAPTHAFSLSRPSTRQDAATKSGGTVISAERGVREWIASSEEAHVPFVTFETHVRRPNLPGSAASAASRRLRALGCPEVERPRTFYVEDMQGPLSTDQLEHARAWGRHLSDQLARQAGRTSPADD